MINKSLFALVISTLLIGNTTTDVSAMDMEDMIVPALSLQTATTTALKEIRYSDAALRLLTPTEKETVIQYTKKIMEICTGSPVIGGKIVVFPFRKGLGCLYNSILTQCIAALETTTSDGEINLETLHRLSNVEIPEDQNSSVLCRLIVCSILREVIYEIKRYLRETDPQKRDLTAFEILMAE